MTRSSLSDKFLEKCYKYRNKLVAVPLMVAIFVTWGEYEKWHVIWLGGGIVYLLGLLLRIWAQQHLHFRLGMEMKLTRSGPYSYVRNPIYIGNTLICIGIGIMSELLWLVPFIILTCCFVYHFTVLHEERKLTKLYGEEYLMYANEVPRWMPKWGKKAQLGMVGQYLGLSLRAEAYNLLLILPVVVKELFAR